MIRLLPTTALLALLFTAPVLHAQESTPAPPAGLTSEIYSSSAVEIFWERSFTVSNYIVVRDGVELARTSGTSFFEEGLIPNTTYQYEIRSVDSRGTESAESSDITVSTRGGLPETDATRPLSLRAEVYSSTALELFWRQDFNFPQAFYEIRRDGVLIDISNGISFFEEGLTPNTTYEYSVTQRGTDAPAATITSTTTGGNNVADNSSNNDTDSTDGTNDNGNPVLQNARLVVYSDTAAELLWDRPPVEAGIARIEVIRDTESLGRIDATSFFDGDREPGVSYNYALIARDSGGSELGRVNLSDSEALAPQSVEFVSPILGQFNEVDIVNLVFATLSGQAFGNDLHRMPYHSDPTYSNVDLLGGAPADAVSANIVCDNGGTAAFEPVLIDNPADGGWDFSFDNCLDGTELIDGEIERVLTGALTVDSESGIRIDGTARVAEFSGTLERRFRERDDIFDQTITAENLNFLFTENNETFEVVDGNFNYFFSGPVALTAPLTAQMQGSFQMRSPLTQNRLLQVTIDEPFTWVDGVSATNTFFGDWVAFNSGSMTIRAEDGSGFDVRAGRFEGSLQIDDINEEFFTTFFPWSGFSESLPLFNVQFAE